MDDCVKKPRASVVISSYNYARFLSDAIRSALDQIERDVEVIVVDDGSTDNSRDVIAQFGLSVKAIYTPNRGQEAAVNLGFAKSSGDVVIFLDSDDMLRPAAVSTVCRILDDDPEAVKVHWPMDIIDERGNPTGGVKEPCLPEGDFREVIVREGPLAESLLPSAPTSGNAFRRSFLSQVLPVEETVYRVSPDAYLFGLAPAFGRIRRVEQPLSLYRVHGTNVSARTDFERKLAIGLSVQERAYRKLQECYSSLGVLVAPETWRRFGWWSKIDLMITDICSVVTPGSAFVLADLDRFDAGPVIRGRPRLIFMEREGICWGSPDDDQEAIAELERLIAQGADVLALAWPVFWWLDCYRCFASYLRSSFRCLLENERVILYSLKEAPPSTP